MRNLGFFLLFLALTACGRLDEVGRAPGFSPLESSYQHHALYSSPMPEVADPNGPGDQSSLWTSGRASLFGDRRAARRGDILTVVIEIDDKAEISDTTGRSRTGNQSSTVGALVGIPVTAGSGLQNPIDTNSASSFKGTGSVSRKEKLELRIAATIVEELPNGVLRIEGQQEVRVNFELRELIVTGYVRPSDITRQNEITYDKIAGARISYGGRGQITDVQQPAYGQQIMDQILPF